ncbi:MAG: DUF6499 domain-containing protein [Pseudomonadota bacterium]
MPSQDWRDPENYAYTATHDDAHWAGELLRRNPAYKTDWQKAISAGLTRLRVRDKSLSEFASDEWDEMLLFPLLPIGHPNFRLPPNTPEEEDFLSDKWGLRWWLNPETSQPLFLYKSWATMEQLAFYVGGGPGIFAGLREKQSVRIPNGHMAVVFDLGRTLTHQLNAAKANLKTMQQHWLAATGTAKPARKQRTAYNSYTIYLQVFDAKKARATLANIVEHCYGINSEDAAKEGLKQARYWVKNYR